LRNLFLNWLNGFAGRGTGWDGFVCWFDFRTLMFYFLYCDFSFEWEDCFVLVSRHIIQIFFCCFVLVSPVIFKALFWACLGLAPTKENILQLIRKSLWLYNWIDFL